MPPSFDLQTRLENIGEFLGQGWQTPVLRLGVTGLSRAGKTIFITSLVQNLLENTHLLFFSPAKEGRLESVLLLPQPKVDVARFPFEACMDALLNDPPYWPMGTDRISQLRLSFRYRKRKGFSRFFRPSQQLHLDIVDYPGEWILDFPLLDLSFSDWSQRVLAQAEQGERADLSKDWLELVKKIPGERKFSERDAIALHEAYRDFLEKCKGSEAQLALLQPGRFLQPGDLKGSPALTFSPLPTPKRKASTSSIYSEMERRFSHYKAKVVMPFFRDHFAKIDRQIVLLDVMAAADADAESLIELQQAMGLVLGAFRPGPSSLIHRLLGGKSVDRLIFAATKADHLPQPQQSKLMALTRDLLKENANFAKYHGADIAFMSIAGLKSTKDVEVREKGKVFSCVSGEPVDSEETEAFYPGRLPGYLEDLKKQGASGFGQLAFKPPRDLARTGRGLPHINLDKVLDFFLKDRLV